MSLLVYNLTAAPLVLANGLSTPIPASTAGVGVRGKPWYASGNELNGRSGAEYLALQAQQVASSGVGDSFAVAGVNVTLTDAAGVFIANNVGQFITISGATSAANNGSFPVTARTATTITFTNAAGVVEAYTGTYSLPGLMACEWEEYEEYPTQALVVGSAQKEIAENDLSFYADATLGLDTNPGTQALPVQTVEKLLSLVPLGGWRRSCLLFMAPGAYAYSSVGLGGWPNAFRGSGPTASPPALIGAYTTIFGPVAVTAVNADGSVNVAGITPQASGVGAGADAFTFASPAVTLTVAAGNFLAAGVKPGMSVTIAGATTPANNGTFLITAVTATTLVFTNLAGVAEVYAGAYSVIVDRYFGTPRFTVVSGAGIGQTRMCAGNTMTALVPNVPFAGLSIAGPTQSFVQLEVPAVTITLNANWIQAISQIGYKGITFKSAAGAGFIITEAAIAYFEGCVMDFTVGAVLTMPRPGSRLNGTNAGPWTTLGANNPFSNLRNNGVFVDGLQAVLGAINIFDGGSMLGNHLLRNVDAACNTNGFIAINVHGRNSSITCADVSSLALNGASATARAKMSGNRAGTPWLIGCFDGMAANRLNFLDLTNCIGNAIQVGSDTTIPSNNFFGRGGAKVNIGDVAGSVGNTGVGIKYTKGSYVVIDASTGAAVTSVTGALGDTDGRTTPTFPGLNTKTYAAVRTPDLNGVKGWPDTLATTINNMNRIEPPV